MDLYFLGTGAGMPSAERNVTSTVLRMYEERGTFWMFDCGEGTQHQLLKSPLKLSKLEKLFISHLHGDHIYGIPGLLSSRSNQGGESPLELYGPPGTKQWIEKVLAMSDAYLAYDLKIFEYDGGAVLFEDSHCTIFVAKLEHRIDSYGFRIVEKNQPGRLLAEKLKDLGIPPGEMYGWLKKGRNIMLPNGQMVYAHEVTGPEQPGRIIVILGDTRPCGSSLELSENADVLVHESTFAADLSELARKYCHSTCIDAAETALKANAKRLILTHISSRYQETGTGGLLESARSIFKETYIASDFWSFPLPDRKRT